MDQPQTIEGRYRVTGEKPGREPFFGPALTWKNLALWLFEAGFVMAVVQGFYLLFR